MKIYTRTGDDGTTALFGGDRVPKSNAIIDAYGTVDEVNSLIGFAQAHLAAEPRTKRCLGVLRTIQDELFAVGADLATPLDSRAAVSRIEPRHVANLEKTIDEFDSELEQLRHFILPAGSLPASSLHVARTACRRAERLTVKASQSLSINKVVVVYLNRLSDLLFVLARWVNQQLGIDDAIWSP